jgi:uncharacterized delta-60 repeat protein
VICRVCALAVLAVVLSGAGESWAAERPGSVDRVIAQVPYDNDIQGLAVTPDGRVLVGGSFRTFTTPEGWLKAYLPDGTSDTSFGAGGTVGFGSGRGIAALAVQPDGRILVGLTGYPTALRRLHPDGSPDTSFGAGGTLDLDFGARDVYALTLALQADGRLVVAAAPFDSGDGPHAVHVRRYLANGSPDPSFGSGGETVVAMLAGGLVATAALQSDGRIVLVAPGGDSPLRVARLSADGRLDSGFGSGGAAPIELGRRRWVRQVLPAYGWDWQPLVLPDGRIRIPVTFKMRELVSSLGLVGLTANGHPDLRFGRRGLALGPRLDVPEGGEWPRIAVADRHGGIIVVGSTAHDDLLGGEDATIVRRFLRSGQLDRSFGRRGLMRGTLQGGSPFEQELTVLDEDTVVLAEEVLFARYQSYDGGVVSTIHAGYDRDDPSIALTPGCRSLSVRITDLSGIDEVVVRADGRVIRRAHRKRFRTRLPEGARRVSVRATDLAGNSSTRRARLPRC